MPSIHPAARGAAPATAALAAAVRKKLEPLFLRRKRLQRLRLCFPLSCSCSGSLHSGPLLWHSFPLSKALACSVFNGSCLCFGCDGSCLRFGCAHGSLCARSHGGCRALHRCARVQGVLQLHHCGLVGAWCLWRGACCLKRLQHDRKRWLRDRIRRRRCCCLLHGPRRSGEDLGAKRCLRSCFTCFLRSGHCRCCGLQKSCRKRSSTRGTWRGCSGRGRYVWQSLLPGSCCGRAR